jgi:hypothetical protein
LAARRLFGLLLKAVRDPGLWRWLATLAAAVGTFYFIFGVVYGQTSIVAVVDFYILIVLFGFAALGFGYKRFGHDKPRTPRDLKEKLAGYCIIFFGASAVWISGSTLFSDFAQPRLVLEGRVDNLRVTGRRRVDYLADIAGRTVKATTPVYERLKFKPYVRAEVGQGSNYIYRIEYLAD